MTAAPPMLFPVYGFKPNGIRESIAIFFDYDAAVQCIMHPDKHHFRQRNLYLAEPKYDRRERPVPMRKAA
jgi:hypothetical protein